MRLFLSRKVAVILLTATLVLLVLSTRLKNISDLTTSPLFLVLPLFIFISTFLCTINRIKARKIRPPDDSAFRIKKNLDVNNINEVSGYLRLTGWRSIVEREDSLIFIKGMQGFWGSMLFHSGILLMLAASVVTAATLFGAELLLAQGLPVPLGREGLLKVWRDPLVPLRLPEGEIVLDKFDAVFKDDRFPVDYVAGLRIKSGPGPQRAVDVRINEPLNLGPLQYTMDQYGFSPGFLIKDRDGNVLFDGYVSLVLMGGAEDSFVVPGTDAILQIRFFPDFIMTREGASTKSKIPKNPIFGLKIKRGDGSGSGRLVKMGEAAEMDGISITPNDLRYWAHFGVARDAGRHVFAASFLLIVAGLVFRFFHHERWLKVSYLNTPNGFDLLVAGYSRYFPALFEGEIERMVDEIARL